MTSAGVLTAFGLLLQVVGGLVAIWGLVKTHDAYAEKTLAAIASERVRRARDQSVAALRRLLRRRSGRTVEMSAALGGGGAMQARAMVSYGPIPAHMPLRQAINTLDERLRETSERLTRFEQTLENVSEQTRSELTRLGEQVERDATAFRTLVRHAAIEGLMTEAVGLVMVTFGAVLQGIGTVA